VLTGTYRELFSAIAASGAALTGLLFVAMSVAPRRGLAEHPPVIRQVRAASAILAFINALVVSLFGLVPGNSVGYPATAVAVIGIFFTAAGTRSIVSSPSARRHLRGQIPLIILLLAIFGFELDAGIRLLVSPRSIGALELLSNLLVAALIIGIARAWELVGDRDTGIFASIAVLVGREPSLDDASAASGPRDSGRRLSWRGRTSDSHRPDASGADGPSP
jgi:hypothetical protein